MAKKIVITADSTCDLGAELVAKYNIKIKPLYVTLDGEAKLDGIDVTPDDVYEFYNQTGKLAKTAAVNMAEYEDFFNDIKAEEDCAIIHFNISNSMSVTHNNARLAGMELDDVFVIDSANLSTGQGLLVLKACELAESGMEPKAIVKEIEDLKPRVDASFVIDSLEYLHKGGRCSTVAALGANLLKLKPCIEVKGGAMAVGKKYRGKFDAVLKTYVSERLANADDIELDRVFVTHAGCDEEVVNAIIEQVKEALPFKEVLTTRAGCTVSAHCGRNTLGVLFIRKSPIA